MFKIKYLAILQALPLLLLFYNGPSEAQTAPTSNGLTGPSNAVFRSGMWWDPALNGSGWDISQAGHLVHAVWYTYTEEGTPTWYTAWGTLEDGILEAGLYRHEWDYSSAGIANQQRVGDISLRFPSPQLAEIEWSIGEHSGNRTLEPFVFSSEPSLVDQSGLWIERDAPGYGITLQTQGEVTFSVMYYYDPAGLPIWVAGADLNNSGTISMFASEGSCPWCEYEPNTEAPLGEMEINYIHLGEMDVRLELNDGEDYWNKPNVRQTMITTPPSGRPHAAALASLSSPEALRFYFKKGFSNAVNQSSDPWNRIIGVPPPLPFGCLPPVVSPAPPEPAAPEPQPLSQTNVQEAGVDEADMVKATNDWLYSIDHASGSIPETDDELAYQQTISRYRITPDGTRPERDLNFEARIPRMSESGHYSRATNQGLYHYETEDEQLSLLYFAGQQNSNYCGWVADASTQVVVFDADDGADKTPELEFSVEGTLLSTRRIGHQLFVASVYRPKFGCSGERSLWPGIRVDT